jgi:hypothetical protein
MFFKNCRAKEEEEEEEEWFLKERSGWKVLVSLIPMKDEVHLFCTNLREANKVISNAIWESTLITLRRYSCRDHERDTCCPCANTNSKKWTGRNTADTATEGHLSPPLHPSPSWSYHLMVTTSVVFQKCVLSVCTEAFQQLPSADLDCSRYVW